jgi:hypothetical protein
MSRFPCPRSPCHVPFSLPFSRLGCGDCLLLYPTENERSPVRSMLLRHEKSRYGETKDVALRFDRTVQRFEVDPFSEVSASEDLRASRPRRK